MIAKDKPRLTTINMVTALAALLLIASPWLTGFTTNEVASVNALACGAVMLSFVLGSHVPGARLARLDEPSARVSG